LTIENRSIWVLPASHKSCDYPSEHFIASNALQVAAKAGQYIILDCMTFRSGGFDSTSAERRALNHVFTLPCFKQLVRIADNIPDQSLTAEHRKPLGFGYLEPASMAEFLAKRHEK
jgi:ectoine hydroxylase-related dioxygenase (phytanoyl-CoA dioxygenase family)